YNDLNLINNSYEYKLEAEYSTGISEALTALANIEVLYPVVNFTGSLTGTEINLAWENNPLAGNSIISYSLFRNSELYATLTELSYLDSALANGVYEYSVVANYTSGSALPSDVLNFNLEITYPVTNLTAQVTGNIVDLVWDLPANSPRALLSYNIYRDGVIVGNTEELNYSDTALRNAIYSYYVTAEYTSGESDPSNSVEAIVEVLYAPNNLTFNVVENSITLNWDEPNSMYRGFLGYKLFKGEELLTSLTELTYTDNNLINGNYTYSVKAEYSSGDSEASNAVTANVEVLYPAFNLALDIVEDDVTLTWETNLMSGASIIDFTIYRDGQSIGNIAELTYLDEALANGIYAYSVAVNYLTGSSVLAQAVSGLVEVLYPPQNLNCLIEANNVLITWDEAPTSATRSFLGYRLYRDNEEIFFNETATAYNDLNLINNAYEYKLEATYSTGISEALTALVLVEVLYPVVNFTGSLTDTEINLAWENNPLAGNSIVSYSLYRNSELYATLTELSYLDSALANGIYEYSVVANYNSGSAIASDDLIFNLEITYPVNNLTAQVTADVVDLVWDLPVNSPRALLSYNIYRDGVVVGNTEELNYSDTALTNAIYSYYVTAEYTSGESDPSNSVTAIVEVLYAPNNLTFSVVENNITLSWEEPNTMYRGFIGYKLFKDGELLVSQTELTYTDNDLINGDYTYSVKAEYSSGDSEASNAVTVNLEVLYPANNLTGTLNIDEVTLAWDSPSELYRSFLGYNIYRNNELIDSTLETSFVDSYLANGSHTYYIKANYTTGESTPTNSVEFFVEITYPVTSLSATVDENNVALTWEIPAVSAQTRAFRGYFIYRNNAIATVIENPATTSWTDTSLANGDYEYYLKAVYDAGISVESNVVNVNIEILPDLFAPTNLQLFVENERDVHLTWDIPSAEANSYLIFKDNLEVATSNNNSYWDNDLPNGSYHYHVKAVYPEGISSPSNIVVANIATTDTPNNLATAITNGNDVVLTWETPNNGETAFIINRNGEELTYISDVAQVEYIDQGLTNALYTYTIRAVYNHQFSELSNPAYADVMKLYTPQISYYQAIDNYISFTWEDLTPWGKLVDYTVYKNGEELANITASSYTEADLTNGNYDFTVSANFDFGSSEQSTTISFEILMPQMVTNVATTITNNDLVLSWDYPVDTGLISSYKVYRDGVVIATTQDNSFTDVDLVNGDYSYQIMTFYNDTIDNPITEALVVAYINAYPITNLSTNIVDQDIVLDWDSPLDMYGFIHYEVSRNDEFVMNLLDTENEFIDIAPENGLYQYTIKSVYQNDAEVEVVSESVNFIIPVSPTNLAISTEEIVNLTWDFAGTDYAVTGFEVYNDEELLTTTTANTYELDLINGNYNFKISTAYGAIVSEYSDILSYELVKTYPVLNVAAELTGSDLELNWDSPADTYGLDSITIIRTLSDEGRLEVVLAATATSYLNEDISNGIYNYDIVANYGSAIQVDKIVSIIDISIINAMPATDLAVVATGNDLLLSWNEPVDIFGFSTYQVYQNNTLVGTTENSEYAFADQANGDYTFKVKSIYTQDNEIFSETLDYTLIIAYPALNASLELVDNDLVMGWTNPNDTFGLDNFTLLNNATVIGQTDSQSFVIINAANGVYNITLRANYSNDTSAEVVIANDYVKLVPHQVGSVTVAVSSGIPQISWIAPTDLFSLVGYNVYSMTSDVVEQPELWTTIDTLITDSSIVDDVTELITGNYQWAVVTVYRDNLNDINIYSEAKFSDVLTDNNNQDVVAITSITGNYPNPFNPETQISFQIAKDSHVSMNVYNIKGQLVKSLVNENMKSGSHTITWHGKDNSGRTASSGVYFFRLSNNGVSKAHKCTLMK
ncbi:MAG: FlgD immunoglobulin-like domain containing protein, partial [Candidatus Cloacimonadales bacterium]